LIPEGMIEQLLQVMPKHQGDLAEGDEEGYNYEKYMELVMGKKLSDGVNGH